MNELGGGAKTEFVPGAGNPRYATARKTPDLDPPLVSTNT